MTQQKKSFAKKKGLGSRGQAFEAYRFLIAAVIALAVLVIIVGVINYFDQKRQDISFDNLYTGWQSAVSSPDGKVIQVAGLSFKKDTRFGKVQFVKLVNLVEDCVQFDANPATGFQLINGDETVEVQTSVQGNAYIQCTTDPPSGFTSNSACFAYCLISFGKSISVEP